jgi:5-methyltetrahydropteroyltriglutamate--homocysteine methyltransferase
LYPPLITVAGRAQVTNAGFDVDAILATAIEADRMVFAGLDAPPDYRVGLDLVNSGPLPTTQDGYDVAALEALIGDTPFHRLCVDYPNDSLSRVPLERIKPGLVLSLGVVDVSTPRLEPVDDLLRIADEAVDERGTDDVAFSTNGGFAMVANQPLMTVEEQHNKLQLVEVVSRYYWGNEI